jgi:hypothetical protein
MKVDFHLHSSFSDGTFSPEEIAVQADRIGMRHYIITDHDNVDAGSRGIELAVDPGEGLDQFHLLGLGIDPRHEGLRKFLRKILNGRNERNQVIIGRFARLGIEIPADEIAAYAHGEVLARPHFARWLMDKGYVKSISEAFSRYLMKDSPESTSCFVERYQPSQEEAIGVVHAAGGIAVMAHPRYWSFRWKTEGVDFSVVERNLWPLKEMGLDGLEALYEANTPEINVEFTRMADRLGLVKSAGSDFHGTNKPNIALGMEVSESFISPLLERLFMI